MKTRIYYHHTDSGGVVYYGTYLSMLEEARTLYLEEKGVFIPRLMAKDAFFVVGRQTMDYRAPAYYGDELETSVEVSKVSPVRIELFCQVRNQNGKLICEGITTCVLIGSDFKPKPLPADMKEKLEACLTVKK